MLYKLYCMFKNNEVSEVKDYPTIYVVAARNRPPLLDLPFLEYNSSQNIVKCEIVSFLYFERPFWNIFIMYM